MTLIDNYRRGWALRYLREAKAELTAAQKIPYMASSRLLEASRKAQAAVYYSLGDPGSIEAIVHQVVLQRQSVEEPVLRCLVEIERAVQQVAQMSNSDREAAMKQAGDIVQLASDIVELFTGERGD